MSRFRLLMSVKDSSISANSGTVSRSATSFLVNPTDPAPIKATFMASIQYALSFLKTPFCLKRDLTRPQVVTNVITMKTKVRKIGNSLGIVLPKEALQAMHVEEGSSLYITRGADNSVHLTADRPGFEEVMKVAEKGMQRYRNALKELAK